MNIDSGPANADSDDVLAELLAAVRDGEATPQQMNRLKELVASDSVIALRYVEYMHLCAELHPAYRPLGGASLPPGGRSAKECPATALVHPRLPRAVR